MFPGGSGRLLWFSPDLPCISSRGLQCTTGTISRLTSSVSLYMPFPYSSSHPVSVPTDELFPCCRGPESQRIVCSLLKRWPLGPWCPSTNLHLFLWLLPTFFDTPRKIPTFITHLIFKEVSSCSCHFRRKLLLKTCGSSCFFRSSLEALQLCLQRSWKWLVCWRTETTISYMMQKPPLSPHLLLMSVFS